MIAAHNDVSGDVVYRQLTVLADTLCQSVIQAHSITTTQSLLQRDSH